MRLLIVNPGTDIAGCGIALKRAFDQHSDWDAAHVRRRPSPFDYLVDQDWSRLGPLWKRADVVHVMDDPRILLRMPRRRNVVVQHLGSSYLKNPNGLSAICEQYGAKQASGGLYLPTDAPWLPVAVDMPLRSPNSPTGRVKVAHAPTNRVLKSTAILQAAMEGLDADFDIIEGVTNRECVERKARAHIYFDELTYGYGLNAIEAWVLGLPVVSGMTEGRQAFLAAFGETPWQDATPDTLHDVLERLIEDQEHRAAVASRGQAFMERYHSPAVVVARHLEMYGC